MYKRQAPYNALLPFLLRFQLLLLGDILLQLAFAPAVDLGLFGALDAQRLSLIHI